MNVLLDECLPKRLAAMMTGHEVKTTRQMNWHGLSNGRLLPADAYFDVFLTCAKNLVNQQNIAALRLAVAILRARSNKIEDLAPLVPRLLALLPTLMPGQIITIG